MDLKEIALTIALIIFSIAFFVFGVPFFAVLIEDFKCNMILRHEKLTLEHEKEMAEIMRIRKSMQGMSEEVKP